MSILHMYIIDQKNKKNTIHKHTLTHTDIGMASSFLFICFYLESATFKRMYNLKNIIFLSLSWNNARAFHKHYLHFLWIFKATVKGWLSETAYEGRAFAEADLLMQRTR